MNFNFKTRVAFNATGTRPPLSKGWLFVILAALLIPHWIDFYQHLNDTIAPDLFLRTIGSRLQEANLPIYEYQWQPGNPVALLNPYPDTRVGLNGVVSTPFMLWLLQPFSRLNYCTIKLWWGIIQEIFLFASVWFCCITITKRSRQLLFVAVAAMFFIYSRNWLLNIYNGQLYVIYAFTFSLAGFLIIRFKNVISSIVFFALLSTVRPFFITALVPLLKIKKGHVFALLIAITVSSTLVFITTKKSEWSQYNNAMKLYAKEKSNELVINTSATSYVQYAEPCTINPNSSFTNFKAGCLFSLQHYLQLFNVSLSSVQVYQAILAVSLLLVWWIGYKRNWLNDVPKQLLLCFVFYQLCELIAPASRNPYNLIQWLPAAAWLIAWGRERVIISLLLGLCLNHDIPFRFAYQRELGEVLMFFAVAVFLFENNKHVQRDLQL